MDRLEQAFASNVIHPSNVSFDYLRCIIGTDCGIHRQLGRGRSVLTSSEQLDQYWYSYAPMIRSQWRWVLPQIQLDLSKVEIIDYGCGQGMASCLFLEHFEEARFDPGLRVTLIEPSALALTRAHRIMQAYAPQAEVISVNSHFQDLASDQLLCDPDRVKIHLFSNVLDIAGYDHFELVNEILQHPGKHIFLAVSHNRNFEGGASRLKEIYNGALALEPSDGVKLTDHSWETFTCSNGAPAVFMGLSLEV